jgi:hypothetical protein
LSSNLLNKVLFQQVAELLQNAQKQVLRTVNSTMTYTYFEIGRMIVEEEQNGKDRAEYGKQVLKGLSDQLISEFGKGFSRDNLENMRRFYLTYSISETLSRISNIQKAQTSSTELESQKMKAPSAEFKRFNTQTLISFFKLTWSHYTFLMRIDDEKERSFYEIESEKYNWSVRELKRQYDSALYTRLAFSKDKEDFIQLIQSI